MRDELLERLNELLKEKGLTEIAAESGISYATLWRISNGKRMGNVETWERLEKYLDEQSRRNGGSHAAKRAAR